MVGVRQRVGRGWGCARPRPPLPNSKSLILRCIRKILSVALLSSGPFLKDPHSSTTSLTSDNCRCTLGLVIVSFKHKGLKRLFEQNDRSGLRADLIDKIDRILTVLDAASAPQALDIPGYRLHQLKGDYKGY